MELTEEKLYQVFGVKPEEGEKEQEPADPAEKEDEDAAAEEEDREEETGEEAEEEEPEESDGEEGGNESDIAKQTPEQRRENAARRRREEQQAAIDAAVKQALEERDAQHAKELETFFEKAGLVNPFNKEPITNMEQFQAWREEQDNQRLQKELQSGKLTKETLNELIDQHPAVQAARQAQEQARQKEQETSQADFDREVERQLAEIRKKDPAVKTVQDLMNRPYSKVFYEAVQRGNNFLDAFYLATRDQEETATTEAARQSAVNNLNGKKHLRATSFGGKAGVTVTAEDRRMYKLFNPKATDEEIQRFQNKYKEENK